MVWYTDKIFGEPASSAVEVDATEMRGTAVSPGQYEGTARVLLDESELERIEQGDVLVCPITSPVWSMVFPALGALVCDSGGPLSHPAIIAREFGIPAVVGTGAATAAIPEGAQVKVDGDSGTVTWRASSNT
jgi:pyruvate,water dikinase